MWQRKMFVGVSMKLDTKVKSEIVAKRLFPTADFRKSDRARVAADGLTDAACIAMYGLRDSSLGSFETPREITKTHMTTPENAWICTDCGVYVPTADEQCNGDTYEKQTI
jgi:hypothetical protein